MSDSDRLDVLLAEHERLRAEIVERLRIQKEVERSQVLLIGILAAASTLVWNNNAHLVLLVASALFFIMGAAFFEQDVNITVLASYIHKRIRPAIVSSLQSDEDSDALLGWEQFRKDQFLPSAVAAVLTTNRTLATYLPGFATLIVYVYVKYRTPLIGQTWNEAELVLMALNVLLAYFLVSLGLKVPRLYDSITTAR